MSLNSTTIYTNARALLNDQNNVLFTNTVLQPLLQIALRDLEAKVILEDGPLLVERTAETTINSGTTVWTSGFPTDVVYPMYLEERAVGSANETDWIRMQFKDPIPNEAQSEMLVYWNWREEAILLLGAISNRNVRMTYKKLIDTVASGGVINVGLQFAENYLEYHLAELAAATIGQNFEIASALGNSANERLEDVLAIIDKHNQKEPIRRRNYSSKYGRINPR